MMTEQQQLLSDTVKKLFADIMVAGMPRPATKDVEDPLWETLEQMGLGELFSPEGFDGSWQDAFYIFNDAGYGAVPLPIGETVVANKLLQDAGLSCERGATTLAQCENAQLSGDSSSGGWSFSGTLGAVPWGAYASHLVAACQTTDGQYLVLLATDDAQSSATYCNDAGEQRADLVFDAAPAVCSADTAAVDKLRSGGALLRCAQMAGALERALELSVNYANERSQFGRPLIKFQAVQHQLAVLAEEAAAVRCAAMAACYAADLGDASFEVAAAKLRANQAVPAATSIAHQAHGAIGFTREHPLHYFTQRLWSWRSEFGNDRYWAKLLGQRVLDEGASHFWQNLTARSDRRNA